MKYRKAKIAESANCSKIAVEPIKSRFSSKFSPGNLKPPFNRKISEASCSDKYSIHLLRSTFEYSAFFCLFFPTRLIVTLRAKGAQSAAKAIVSLKRDGPVIFGPFHAITRHEGSLNARTSGKQRCNTQRVTRHRLNTPTNRHLNHRTHSMDLAYFFLFRVVRSRFSKKKQKSRRTSIGGPTDACKNVASRERRRSSGSTLPRIMTQRKTTGLAIFG